MTKKPRLTEKVRAQFSRAVLDCLADMPREKHPQTAVDVLRQHGSRDYDRERLRWQRWAAVRTAVKQGAVWTDNDVCKKARKLLRENPDIAASAGGLDSIRADYYACEKARRAPGFDLLQHISSL
jgi:hypothetical protein